MSESVARVRRTLDVGDVDDHCDVFNRLPRFYWLSSLDKPWLIVFDDAGVIQWWHMSYLICMTDQNVPQLSDCVSKMHDRHHIIITSERSSHESDKREIRLQNFMPTDCETLFENTRSSCTSRSPVSRSLYSRLQQRRCTNLTDDHIRGLCRVTMYNPFYVNMVSKFLIETELQNVTEYVRICDEVFHGFSIDLTCWRFWHVIGIDRSNQ